MSKRTALVAALSGITAAIAVAAAGGALGAGTAPAQTTAGPGGMGGMGMGGMMGMHVQSEFEYLTHMIPHHEEAIVSARVLEQGTERKAVRVFAGQIIRTQSAEVRQMKAWLAEWYPGRDTRVDYEPMMRDLTGLRGARLDRAFLEDMIPHHMMAVMMSQQLLMGGLAEHRELVPFALRIRNTQHAEIWKMSRWLQTWYGGGWMGMGMGMMGMHGRMGG